MKTIVFLTILVQFSFADEIQFFNGAWNDVSSKATADNKIIFVDVYADWCAPCKWMAANVFTNDSVAQFYNSNFINWTIDAEKGEGINFAKKYEILYYPTFLYLDGNGNIIHKVIGSMPSQDFIAAGKSAADPNASLSSLKNKFESGDRNKEFLKTYIKVLNRSYMPSDEVVNEYFKQLNENELVSIENYDLVSGLSSPNNELFRYFAVNTSKFSQFDDPNISSEALVSYVYLNYLQANAKKMSEDEFNKMLSDIRGFNNPSLNGLDEIMSVTYYKNNRKWDKFIVSVDNYIKNYLQSEEKVIASQKLNDYSWTLYENVSDRNMLKKATAWAKKSVSLDKNFYNIDTYAALLYKTGYKEKALKYYKQSVTLAKKYGEDPKEQEEIIRKIEKELDE